MLLKDFLIARPREKFFENDSVKKLASVLYTSADGVVVLSANPVMWKMNQRTQDSQVSFLLSTSNFYYCYHIFQIKSPLYSQYYAEACNEWQGPFPRFSAWATQLRRNIAAVASRWRHCIRFDRPGNRIPDLAHRL